MRLAFALLPTLFGCTLVNAAGKDATFVLVSKNIGYTQTSASAPVILATNGFFFRARVELSPGATLSSASLKWPMPVNATRPLLEGSSAWEFSQSYNAQSALNLAHPIGTYQLVSTSAADGRHTNTVTLSADVYPNPV